MESRCETDVVVIGAGPAGMAAAALLADEGARVLVVDEQPAPGGQVYRAAEQVAARPDGAALRAALGADYAAGLDLVRRFRASGAMCWQAATAWHLAADRTLWVSREGGSTAVSARVILLATGAMERPVPLPGWTLPGVFMAGALQLLMKSGGLVPEGRVVLAGAGPLLYLVAQQCLDLGVGLAAVLETATAGRSLLAARYLPRVLLGGGWPYLRRGLALKARLRRERVPVFNGVTDLAVDGTDRVMGIAFRAGGQRCRIGCDVVGLHEGVIPHTQFARMAGCELRWETRQRCFAPVVDAWGNSSVASVMIVGDGASIEGAGSAACRGRIAGWEALRQLGAIVAGERDRRSEPDRRARRAHAAVRPLLDALYPPPVQIRAPADDVMVCRCEEITAAAIRAAARNGARRTDHLKGGTRCGMGPCQGRQCGPVAAEIIAAECGLAIEAVGLFRARAPLKPVTMGELASCGLAGGGLVAG